MGKVKIGSRVLVLERVVERSAGNVFFTMISCLAPLGTIFKLNNVQRMSASTSNRHLYRSLLRELRLSVGDCPPPPGGSIHLPRGSLVVHPRKAFLMQEL